MRTSRIFLRGYKVYCFSSWMEPKVLILFLDWQNLFGKIKVSTCRSECIRVTSMLIENGNTFSFDALITFLSVFPLRCPILTRARLICYFFGPIAKLILGHEKIPVSEISSNIIHIYHWLNVVIKYLWQRYVMEAGYLTFEQTLFQTSVQWRVNTSLISYHKIHRHLLD